MIDGNHRFAITIAYDGTDFQGFQSQTHGNTIQDQIESRLARMLRRRLRIFGWGRTDSGVHARGAVISVDLTADEVDWLAGARKDAMEGTSNLDLAARSLLSVLKDFACNGGSGSITARSVAPVPSDFDPRFSSLWKRYIYFVSFGSRQRSPFLNRYSWQIDDDLDIPKMVIAAYALSGRHNFGWLSIVQEGERRDPVRALNLEVEEVKMGNFFDTHENTDCRTIKISGTCDFFLYRMMRRLVGILVAIGKRQIDQAQLDQHILQCDDASMSPEQFSKTIPSELLQTAPAKGLCLEHIEYAVPI